MARQRLAATGASTVRWYALALQLAAFKPGQTVLITGAAGRVGIATIQLVAQAGGRAVGTGSDAQTLAALRECGLSEAIDTTAGAIDAQIRARLGGGVDCLAENVGGKSLAEGLAGLTDGSALVLAPALAKAPVRLTVRVPTS